MKRLSMWDTYVQEAKKQGDRSIELPLTDDEVFVVPYPTRRQARLIGQAQRVGDVDSLLAAMLGEEAGRRVSELADDQPAYVLDEFLLDVMKKFGMLPDDEGTTSVDDATEAVNGVEVDDPSAGKSITPKSRKPSKTSSAASS